MLDADRERRKMKNYYYKYWLNYLFNRVEELEERISS